MLQKLRNLIFGEPVKFEQHLVGELKAAEAQVVKLETALVTDIDELAARISAKVVAELRAAAKAGKAAIAKAPRVKRTTKKAAKK